MIEIPTKKTRNFELPILGLGTWQMGGSYDHDLNNDDERDIQGIRSAMDSGITHIDTAEQYASGYSELLIGKAIKDKNRDSLFITSKVSPAHYQYDDLITAAKASLERLQIKQFDLYLIHWPHKDMDLKETMSAMDFLLENELTKYIGVSNFNSEWLQEAQSYTKYKIVNNQIHYSLSARHYEKDGTLDFCKKSDILVTAYRPTAKGEFAKKEYEVLKRLAKKYNKTPVQVALNWVIGKPNIVTLFKTSDAKHLEENLGSINWQLEKEDEEALDKDFPSGKTMMPEHYGFA